MKIKILSDITSWKTYRNLESGKIYDMPPGDAQKLIQGGQAAEVIEEGKPGAATEPKKSPQTKEVGGGAGPLIDPELSSWLVSKGFVREPEGVAYVRQDKVGEDLVKLQVDFSDTQKGSRYGYRLNLQSDPPEWKPDKALHDHPLLLQFKRFRDDLLARREVRVQIPPGPPKLTEVPAGGGTKLALLPPEVEEAKEMEQRDEALIIKEIKGEIKEKVLSQYFYDFYTNQGRHVVGLSYAGVRAIIRKIGSIRIDELKLEEKKNGWLAICKAHDLRRNLDAVGVAYQLKYFPGGQENPFSLTVAASKAQRNAFRSFIEEKIVTEAYKTFLEERKKESGK